MSKKSKKHQYAPDTSFVVQPTELWVAHFKEQNPPEILRVFGWVKEHAEQGAGIFPVISDSNLNGGMRTLAPSVTRRLEFSEDPDYWAKKSASTVETPYHDALVAQKQTPCPECGATDTLCEHTRIGEVLHTQGRDIDWKKAWDSDRHHHDIKPCTCNVFDKEPPEKDFVESEDFDRRKAGTGPCKDCGAALSFCECADLERIKEEHGEEDSGWSPLCDNRVCAHLPVHGISEHVDSDPSKPLNSALNEHFGIEDDK